jgi:hypothetical protein
MIVEAVLEILDRRNPKNLLRAHESWEFFARALYLTRRTNMRLA